jgi:hypothetical protein
LPVSRSADAKATSRDFGAPADIRCQFNQIAAWRGTAVGNGTGGADDGSCFESSRRRLAETAGQSASIQRVRPRSPAIVSSITTKARLTPSAVGLREAMPIASTTSNGETANANRKVSPPALD